MTLSKAKSFKLLSAPSFVFIACNFGVYSYCSLHSTNKTIFLFSTIAINGKGILDCLLGLLIDS